MVFLHPRSPCQRRWLDSVRISNYESVCDGECQLSGNAVSLAKCEAVPEHISADSRRSPSRYLFGNASSMVDKLFNPSEANGFLVFSALYR